MEDKKNKPEMSLETKRAFKPNNFKLLLRAIAFLLLLFILYFMARAGIEKYPDIYSIDAKMENGMEIDPNAEIKIVFSQPVIFLDKKNISISPSIEYEIILSEDGKELTLKTKKPFLSETKYEIGLKDVRGLSGLVMDGRKFIVFSKSSKKELKNADAEKDNVAFSELQLSKNRYMPPESSVPKADIEIEPQFKEGRYIDVSISHQIMTLFEDGIKVNSFLISSGRPGMPTPYGTYSILRKEQNHWSGYGLWMPYSMNFFGSFYIHELPYWPGGYREGENHLGIRVSHGCVRLGIGPAKYVYDWAEIGTPVYIHK